MCRGIFENFSTAHSSQGQEGDAFTIRGPHTAQSVVCRKTHLVNTEDVTAKISGEVSRGQGMPLTISHNRAYFCGDFFHVYEGGFAAHHEPGRPRSFSPEHHEGSKIRGGGAD